MTISNIAFSVVFEHMIYIVVGIELNHRKTLGIAMAVQPTHQRSTSSSSPKLTPMWHHLAIKHGCSWEVTIFFMTKSSSSCRCSLIFCRCFKSCLLLDLPQNGWFFFNAPWTLNAPLLHRHRPTPRCLWAAMGWRPLFSSEIQHFVGKNMGQTTITNHNNTW